MNLNTADKKFKCPCHCGVYDRYGLVVSGPPPAPMERRETLIMTATAIARNNWREQTRAMKIPCCA